MPNSPPKYHPTAAAGFAGEPNRCRQRHHSSPRPAIDAALQARAAISQPGLACAIAVRMLGH